MALPAKESAPVFKEIQTLQSFSFTENPSTRQPSPPQYAELAAASAAQSTTPVRQSPTPMARGPSP